jgi:hypothetical protein
MAWPLYARVKNPHYLLNRRLGETGSCFREEKNLPLLKIKPWSVKT